MSDFYNPGMQIHLVGNVPDSPELGPSYDDIATAILEEYGPGPISFNIDRPQSPERIRRARIIERLERAANWGIGIGVGSGLVCVASSFAERPDIATPMKCVAIGSFCLGVISAYIKDFRQYHLYD